MATDATKQGNPTYGGVPVLVSPVTGAGSAVQLSSPGAPGIPSIDSESQKATYSYATSSITPAATPTELFQFGGIGAAVAKLARVKRINIAATSTVSGALHCALIRRSASGSGGTSASGTVSKFDTSDPTASASVLSFTANPTVGTTVSILKTFLLPTGANGPNVELDFSDNNDKAIVLRPGEYLGVNGLASALPNADVRIDFSIEWTEEANNT